MSNVIKAHTVRYAEDKRVLDMNERAERIRLLYSEIFDNKDKDANPVFVEGLKAEKIDVDEEAFNEQAPDELSEEEHNKLFEMSAEDVRHLEEEASAIVEEARAEAEDILNKARAEAIAVKQEAYEAAKKEGYAEGALKAEEDYKAKEKELETFRAELIEKNEEEKKKLEPEIIDIICAIVKKLTRVFAEDKSDIIQYLIEQELSDIEKSDRYLIRVSKADYEAVSSRKSELLWKIKEGAEIEIIDDPILTKTQCLIETDSRIIDCSIDVQLKNLITDLKLLAGDVR